VVGEIDTSSIQSNILFWDIASIADNFTINYALIIQDIIIRNLSLRL